MAQSSENKTSHVNLGKQHGLKECQTLKGQLKKKTQTAQEIAADR